jgi:crotonobetainyl-CoA:carnitine CoA-transferase CaiB-like acyl-CoA transferase
MPQPLSGVRILDLTRLLPGGVCTMLLADLGADVVKIEDPNGGDYARWLPPAIDGQSVYFRMNNRNKRGMILDLKRAEGQAILRKLVETADALVEGFRPEVMARLNCDYAALKAVNPRLVYCSISGWGADGPYADRSGHDLNYLSIAGFPGAMETPSVPGGEVADIGGAYIAVAGILAGLFGAARTGEGCYVDVSLFESSLPFVLYPWVETLMTGIKPPGGLTGGAACYNIYKTRDGEAVSLAALEPKFWGNFCAAIERPDLIPDYLTPERQPYLRAELTGIFSLRTLDECRILLENADCCFAVVNPPGALGDNPHVRARGMVGIGEDGAPWMRSPIRMGGPFAPGNVPGYGEHTRAVLREAGYTDMEIDGFVAMGVARES